MSQLADTLTWLERRISTMRSEVAAGLRRPDDRTLTSYLACQRELLDIDGDPFATVDDGPRAVKATS